MAAAPNVDPALIVSTNLDQQLILQTVQMYQPSFQLTNVRRALAFVDNNQSQVSSVLSGMQSNGLSGHILTLANQAGQIGAYLADGGTSTAASVRRGMTPNRTIQDPYPGDGGGAARGYSCQTDGALIFAAGIAFATIFVMTLGAAAPLAGAAWGGIAAFGGLGTTGWGIGHAVAGCSF